MNARTPWRTPLLVIVAALAACSRTEPLVDDAALRDAAPPDRVTPDVPGLDAMDEATPPPDLPPPPPDEPAALDAPEEPPPPPDAVMEELPPPPDVPDDEPPPDAPVCTSPRVMCGTTCTDLEVDSANCGACGLVCPAGRRCAFGRCGCGASCPPGQSICGDCRCIDLRTDPANCGGCSRDCNALPGVRPGAARCVDGRCDLSAACVAGRGVCGPAESGCTTDLGTPANCGACGRTCPATAPLCAMTPGGDYACTSGCPAIAPDRCGMACVNLQTDVTHCGRCGNACPGTSDGVGACVMGACTVVCAAGHHRCGTSCPSDRSVLSCGPTSCSPCPTPPANATATCDGTACGFACNAGFTRVGEACAPMGPVAPPRPVWPPSTATVTTRRPTFQWALAAGTDGARVQVCRDRACATLVTTFDALGARGAPGADLPTGALFWRLLGRAGAATGTTASVVWQLTLPARSAAAETAWGSALDANGDGVGDLLVGAPGVGAVAGRAYVHAGRAGVGVAGPPLAGLTGVAGAGFGQSVASAGDVNGDGFADVLVGSPRAGGGSGRIDLYFGGPTGPAAAPSNTVLAPEAGGNFGHAVAAAGDLNRDGYGDLVVGAYLAAGTGRVHVFYGSAGGVTARPSATLSSPAAGGGSFGYAVAGAGDVNGDGYADVVVGANGVSAGAGAAYVYLGGAAGLAATPAVTFANPGAGSAFGTSVGGVGDLNGDGLGDVAVGAERFSADAGRVYVFLGRALGPAPAASLTIASPNAGSFFGTPVTAAGDVNGDGFGDLLVGARGAPAGRAHVFHGAASGVALAPSGTLLGPDGAGGAFGQGAAGAGDVNGDGFGDVAVGAPAAAMSAGRVHVYLGTAAGLRATPQASLAGPDGPGGRYGAAAD